MDKTENNDFQQAKQQIDFIFVINLVCIQKVHQIGSLEVDVSQMHIMGAWSQLYMNVSWLQRLYHKASLEDSEQVSVEIPLSGDRALDLKSVIEHLESALQRMENTSFSPLNYLERPDHIFNLIFDRIYAGMFEALSLLERELQLIENTPKGGDDEQMDPT